MKFKVRPDYVIHLNTTAEVTVNGRTQPQEQTQSYYGGQDCELTEQQARDHAFKLHPTDEQSASFLDSLVVKSLGEAPTPGTPEFHAAVAAAVGKILADMGVKSKATA